LLHLKRQEKGPESPVSGVYPWRKTGRNFTFRKIICSFALVGGKTK
jgi:hypothetical protein